MEPLIGTVFLFAGNFAPRGYMLCQGQLMSIAQNTALFSILGTTYGGDGQTTFALPDLRGRVPMGTGQGPGLNNYILGEETGTENVTLLSTQMPQHSHNMMVSTSNANSPQATNNYLAVANGDFQGDNVTVNTYNGTPNAALGGNSIGIAGGSQPHENLQPSLVMNYIIAIEGIFPSRN
jgi:microcystin-dependent protein